MSYERGTTHLCAAIVLNLARLPRYMVASRGRSLPVSLGLVGLELVALPLMMMLDVWAWVAHQQRGEDALLRDFVPMSGVGDWRVPAQRRQVWSRRQRLVARQRRWAYIRQGLLDVFAGRFEALAQESASFLVWVWQRQQLDGVALPMTVHLLESIGASSLIAAKLQAQHQGRTDLLYKVFLIAQLVGMNSGMWLDWAAQRAHAQGAAIIANDVPVIPFALVNEAQALDLLV